MKKTMFSLLTLLLVQSQISFAADNTCEKNFGLDVAYCAQSRDFSVLAPKARGAEQKACVDDAQATKDICQNGGGDQCLSLCDTTYSSSLTTCEQNYTLAVSTCGGGLICIQLAENAKAACIALAVSVYDGCVATCTAP